MSENDVILWINSLNNPISLSIWDQFKIDFPNVMVEPLPEIKNPKERVNVLRRINESVWDNNYKISSRISIFRHTRRNEQPLFYLTIKIISKMIYYLGLGTIFNRFVGKQMLNQNTSPVAYDKLNTYKPDFIVYTNPFWFNDIGLQIEADKLKIRSFCYIPSWDNITTKNKLVLSQSAYCVWSQEQKRQLLKYYPESKHKPIYVSGAPQFDAFFDQKFIQTKEEFCNQLELDTNLPIILFAIGSPNFIKNEDLVVEQFISKIKDGQLGKVQILIRPHPIHSNGQWDKIENSEFIHVVIQNRNSSKLKTNLRTMDFSSIQEWLNTFKYCDVVVQFCSTVALDGSYFHKPIVNLNFDPDPLKKQDKLMKEINESWEHFSPLHHSGAYYTANNIEEVVKGVSKGLNYPLEKESKRIEMLNFVTENLDGQSGKRLAEAINDFARKI